jgi:small ligand-binding sensory domain FIST
LQERLRGLLASAAGVGEIDVRLNGIRARQPVLTGLQPIEHRAIVGNQDDQILTRVDRLCFKGIRRREDSIDKSTRTVRVQ